MNLASNGRDFVLPVISKETLAVVDGGAEKKKKGVAGVYRGPVRRQEQHEGSLVQPSLTLSSASVGGEGPQSPDGVKGAADEGLAVARATPDQRPRRQQQPRHGVE